MTPRHPVVAGALLAVLAAHAGVGCSSSRRSRPGAADTPSPAPPLDAPAVFRPPAGDAPSVPACPLAEPFSLGEPGFEIRLMTGGANAVVQRLSICDLAALGRDGEGCFPPPPLVFRGCDPPVPVNGVPALGPDGLLFHSLIAGDGTPWFSVRPFQRVRTVGWAAAGGGFLEAVRDVSDERSRPWFFRLAGGAVGIASEPGGALDRWLDGSSTAPFGRDRVLAISGGRAGLPTVLEVQSSGDGDGRLAVVDDGGVAHTLAAPLGAHRSLGAAEGPWHCVEDPDGAGRFLRVDDVTGEVASAFDLPGSAPCRTDLATWLPARDALLVVAASERDGSRGPLLLVRGDEAPTTLHRAFGGPVHTGGSGTTVLVAEGDGSRPTSTVMRVHLDTGDVSAVADDAPSRVQLHARGAYLAYTGFEGSTLVLGALASEDGGFEVRRHALEGVLATNLTLSRSGVLWFEERQAIPDGPFSLWSLGPSGAQRHRTQPLPVGGPIPAGPDLLLAARPAAGTTELVRLHGEETSTLGVSAGPLGASNLMTWGGVESNGIDGAGYAWVLADGRLGRYREGAWTSVLDETSTYALVGVPAPGVRIVDRFLGPGRRHDVLLLADGEATVLARDVAFAEAVFRDRGDRDGRRRQPWGWAIARWDDGREALLEMCPFDAELDGVCRRARWAADPPTADGNAYLAAAVSRDGWVTVAIRTPPPGADDEPHAQVVRFPPPDIVP